MTLEELFEAADIEDSEDFQYFDQFSAIMEADLPELDYDDFAELMLVPAAEALSEMTESFFDDLIKGVPDDNTELYSIIQTIKETLTGLAKNTRHRGRGFYADELFRFRSWLREADAVVCTPEKGGSAIRVSPLEALTLFREEKLAGEKYTYDFSECMPAEPDEYTLTAMAEAADDVYAYDGDYEENPEEEDALPVELPSDWDPDTWDPDDPLGMKGPIDPYTEGFVDRYHPVMDDELEMQQDEDYTPYND